VVVEENITKKGEKKRKTPTTIGPSGSLTHSNYDFFFEDKTHDEYVYASEDSHMWSLPGWRELSDLTQLIRGLHFHVTPSQKRA